MNPPSSTETLPKAIQYSNQRLVDNITTDSAMTADTSSLPSMARPKSTSTLTSSNVLSSTVWSVIVPNVSNATSSLITSSVNLQGYAKYVSWKTVFNVKHSLHAGSVMEIQA